MCPISYLHIRLLALRPVLAAFIAFDTSDRETDPLLQNFLSRRVIFQSSVVCVRVATEAINTVALRRGQDPGVIVNLAPWWYNVLFLYSAATILIAARLSDILLSEVSESLVFDSWRRAIEALEHYSVYGTSIKRLVSMLRVLSDTVPHHFSRLRPNPQSNVNLPKRNFIIDTTTPLNQGNLVDSDLLDTEVQTMPGIERQNPENDLLLEHNLFQELNTTFDWNDLSWLTAVPFEMHDVMNLPD